jgi:hypothetical protein
MKNLILSMSLLLCTNLIAQKSGALNSAWHKDSGEDPVPSASEYLYHSKGKFNYYISNNNEYIYLLLTIPDRETQTGILKSGLTIWISMDNKPSKNLGVRYPLGSLNSNSRNITGPDVNSNNISDTDTLISLANTIELVGFISEENRKFPSDNTDNFRGFINIDNDEIMHYLLRMPSAKLPLRNSRNSYGAMPFTLGIEIGSDQNGSKPEYYTIKNIKLASGLNP